MFTAVVQVKQSIHLCYYTPHTATGALYSCISISRGTASASCTRVIHNYTSTRKRISWVVLRIVYTSRPYNRHDTYAQIYIYILGVEGGTV